MARAVAFGLYIGYTTPDMNAEKSDVIINVSKSAEHTFLLGEKLAHRLKSGDVVALYGGLGAGKTVFVKGIAKGLGIEDDVTSPTFTFLRQYQGRLPLFHFDLYRIEDEMELYCIGLYDFAGGENVCVVEWAERAQSLFPNIIVRFSGSGSDVRNITINEDKDAYTGG